jgi:hypothetical protein
VVSRSRQGKRVYRCAGMHGRAEGRVVCAGCCTSAAGALAALCCMHLHCPPCCCSYGGQP